MLTVTPEADVIYLDYAATTPVDPVVVRAMNACMGPDGDFGNAGSATHRFGHRAAARVEAARVQVASLLSAEPDEIIAMLRERERAGLREITILPPIHCAREVYQDFAEQIIARY